MTNLDLITLMLVKKVKSIGLFHYNKITYLFEYLFIKNFGRRFTKELFVKLPHGPVISNYKRQISNLGDLGFIQFDDSLLKEKRIVDDYKYHTIYLNSTKLLSSFELSQNCVDLLLTQVIDNYFSMSIQDLEKKVYETQPMQKYLNQVQAGFKKPKGGYVLKDCVKISQFKNQITDGRRLAFKHLEKYPVVDFERQNELAIELKTLENLRPSI